MIPHLRAGHRIVAVMCVVLATRANGGTLTMLVVGTPHPPTNIQRSTLPEKESRTPAQQKINSALLYEVYRRRGQAAEKRVPPGETGVRIDRKGRALVDARADVTPRIEKKVRSLGGTIVSTSFEDHSIIAWVPVLKLEQLAADHAVRAIEPAAEATIR